MSRDGTHFIQARIEADRARGAWGGRVATRFPPEPNGFLHLGHVKTIVLNFGLAEQYGGTCNLRFDDTNPVTEDARFAESIVRDVAWLGYAPSRVVHASDWFDALYDYAEQLVREGLAYVDDQDLDAIRATRGTVTEAGTPSPWRSRTPAENLDLLRRMKAGEFADGAKVLRAKIDMAHPNMKLRDPLMYRIKHAHHWRTGDRWCLYPMYDWAHGQCDALEGITHSICTLEFEVNRPLYDWFTEALRLPEPPRQIEMARLDLTHTVLSKRKLKRLVEEGHVDGWDDPRMPTVAGLRRRGVTAAALRAFCDRVGVARANSTVDIALLEHAIRDDLNRTAPRRMGVVDPLPVEIVNAGALVLRGADFPDDVRSMPAVEGVDVDGVRQIPWSSRILIERSDFAEDPPAGFRRLIPGGEVRLRYGPVLKCEAVLRDQAGAVVGLRASIDADTVGRAPVGRTVKGTIHWVPADTAVEAEIRWVDRLFSAAAPEAEGDFLAVLNPDSLRVGTVWMEPAVAQDAPGVRYQLERHGYVYRDPEAQGDRPVFTVVVGLKDRWSAGEASSDGEPARERPASETLSAEENAARRAASREAWFAQTPGARAAFDGLVAQGASEDVAWTVVSDPRLAALHGGAVAAGASAGGAAAWIASALLADKPDLDALRFDGAALARLLRLVEAGTLSTALARKVQGVLLAEGGDPEAIATARGWLQQSDEAALAAVVEAVFADHPDEAARFAAGDTRVGGFLIGQIMRRTQGRANPQVVRDLVAARSGGGA